MKCPHCSEELELKNFKKEGMWHNHWWCHTCNEVQDPTAGSWPVREVGSPEFKELHKEFLDFLDSVDKQINKCIGIDPGDLK